MVYGYISHPFNYIIYYKVILLSIWYDFCICSFCPLRLLSIIRFLFGALIVTGNQCNVLGWGIIISENNDLWRNQFNVYFVYICLFAYRSVCYSFSFFIWRRAQGPEEKQIDSPTMGLVTKRIHENVLLMFKSCKWKNRQSEVGSTQIRSISAKKKTVWNWC